MTELRTNRNLVKKKFMETKKDCRKSVAGSKGWLSLTMGQHSKRTKKKLKYPQGSRTQLKKLLYKSSTAGFEPTRPKSYDIYLAAGAVRVIPINHSGKLTV